MDELNQFEARFAERLRAYSAAAARRPDAEALARALESRRVVELRRPWWTRFGRGPRMFVLVGAALLAIGGGALVAGSRPVVLPSTPEPMLLAWGPERAQQDWPGALRAEPPGDPLIVGGAATIPTNQRRLYSTRMHIDARDDVAPDVALADIVEVQFGQTCGWFPPRRVSSLRWLGPCHGHDLILVSSGSHTVWSSTRRVTDIPTSDSGWTTLPESTASGSGEPIS
jgi:hypothetical protein